MALNAGATGLPQTAHELGGRLRHLRGRRGLRGFADTQDAKPGYAVTLSKSQLARYESGETLPPLQYAAHLDRLYEAEGWVEVAIRSLWRGRWDPWAQDNAGPSRFHAAIWPAQFAGAVWLKVKPTAEDVGAIHHIDLEWGPWMRSVDTPVPAEGVLLFTGKAADDDGIPRTCNLSVDRRVFVLHGAGDDFGDELVVDIRRGWRVAPGETDNRQPPGSLMP